MDDVEDNNEIDLRDLLRSILQTRTWVVVSLIVFSGLFWAALAALNLAKPPVTSHSINVYLTFDGATERQYPNGTPYSPNDVIAPAILNRVYENSEIQEYISRQDFISGFTTSPYVPDRDLIMAKYDLDARNLTQAEIEELQSQLRSELNQAASAAITLTFTTTEHNVPSQALAKAIRKVPQAWADYMVNELGTLNFNTTIYSENVINRSLIESMDYLIAIDILDEKTRLLERNLAAIEALPNGRLVRDDESGLSAPDLSTAMADTDRYLIAPLASPIRKYGIARDKDLVQLYFDDQLEKLERDLDVLEAKQGNVQVAYDNYLQGQVSRAPGSTTERGSAASSMIPQFGAEFLDRIVEMTNAGADVAYRQDLNDRRLGIANELAETRARIERLQQLISVLETPPRELGIDEDLKQSYTNRIESTLPVIVDQIESYFRISNRLYAKLGKETFGGASFMFRFASPEVNTSTSGALLSVANLRLYAICIFLLIVVVVPAAMIYNALRDEPEASAASNDRDEQESQRTERATPVQAHSVGSDQSGVR